MGYNLSKLTKYRFLAKSTDIAGALPYTRSFNSANFHNLLEKYGKVIVKPSYGQGGVGVILVSSDMTKNHVRYGTKKRSIHGTGATYAFIKKLTRGKSYIVQQKISLAKIKGRVFDARVMVQRSNSTGWVCTGKLAKVAGPGYIITNVARSNGRVLPLSTAINRSNIRNKDVHRIEQEMEQIALNVGEQLRKYYRINIIGLDVGLDTDGKPWIIEANFRPAKSLFCKLKDKAMYRRIVRFPSQ